MNRDKGSVAGPKPDAGEGRLRTYASPCPSVGFGTCDAAFAAIHGAHGFADFELFRAAASEDWFVDPGNIP